MASSRLAVSGTTVSLSRRGEIPSGSSVAESIIRNVSQEHTRPSAPSNLPQSAPSVLLAHCSRSPTGGHHWLIDRADGPTSRGRCKYCRTRREFSNSFPELDAIERVRYLITQQAVQKELRVVCIDEIVREGF